MVTPMNPNPKALKTSVKIDLPFLLQTLLLNAVAYPNFMILVFNINLFVLKVRFRNCQFQNI